MKAPSNNRKSEATNSKYRFYREAQQDTPQLLFKKLYLL